MFRRCTLTVSDSYKRKYSTEASVFMCSKMKVVLDARCSSSKGSLPESFRKINKN